VGTIDDARAKLIAGQPAREDARLADDVLRHGQIEEGRELVARNFSYACAIAHELDLLTRPPRPIPTRGPPRRRRERIGVGDIRCHLTRRQMLRGWRVR
jgi:hypothetical protein